LKLDFTQNEKQLEARKVIRKAIAAAESDSVALDITLMRGSRMHEIYAKNKTHVRDEGYLDSDVTWNKKQLIMQLKLGVSHLTWRGQSFKLKKLLVFYKQEQNDSCEYCGLVEDTFHVITECDQYCSQRQKINRTIILNGKHRGNYLSLFNDLSIEQVDCIFFFFNDVFKLRNI
jgi:hypothetical protein